MTLIEHASNPAATTGECFQREELKTPSILMQGQQQTEKRFVLVVYDADDKEAFHMDLEVETLSPLRLDHFHNDVFTHTTIRPGGWYAKTALHITDKAFTMGGL